MSFTSAILIGFLGSFHCIGMCGPLFLAIPTKRNPIVNAIVYSVGRSITYAFLGLIIGWFGFLFSLAELQAPLSIGLGSIVLVGTLLYFFSNSTVKKPIFFEKIYKSIQSKVKQLFNRLGHSSLFTIGLVNGLLPCAFVYVGLASAITTVDPIMSAAYMFLFGLGTIPAMVLVAFLGNKVGHSFRNGLQKALPYFAILLGCILVLRGLSLDIPFLSPDLNEIIFGDCSF